MGLYFLKSSSSFEEDAYEKAKSNKYKDTETMGVVGTRSSFGSSGSINPNPDPSNYKILRAEVHKEMLVMWIHYPNCTNYEGKKILVFDNGVTLLDIVNQKLIDPHFCNNSKYISPIARFEPTDRGWKWAISFASSNSESYL